MATMGKYCKAYSIKKLHEFKGWSEEAENARMEKKKGTDVKEIEAQRVLTDEDYLYLQENHVVTDGVYKDQNIIFDQVTLEWKIFCAEALKFEIPDYARDAGESSVLKK